MNSSSALSTIRGGNQARRLFSAPSNLFLLLNSGLLVALSITTPTSRAGAADPVRLTFPVQNFTPYQAPVTAVFDHAMTTAYETTGDNYGKVIAFTGEQGLIARPGFKGGASGLLYGYSTIDKHVFLPCMNYYRDTTRYPQTDRETLYYDGHPGYDYAFDYDTPLFPAISGYVSYQRAPAGGSASGFHVLSIDPNPTDNTDISVYYLHLATYPAADGTIRHWRADNSLAPTCALCPREGEWVDVDRTNPIGYSGSWNAPSAHLHFEVHQGDQSVDPYDDSPDGSKRLWAVAPTAACLQVGPGVTAGLVTSYEVSASHFTANGLIRRFILRPSQQWSSEGTSMADEKGRTQWTVSTNCSDSPGATRLRAVDELSWRKGDFNSDGIVNSVDYSILNKAWFTTDAYIDLNHDGLVNSIDFSILNANWLQKGNDEGVSKDIVLNRSSTCGG